MSFPRCGLRTSLAVVVGLLPIALSAQSYGPDEQVLTIGAAAFRGQSQQPVFHPDGYLYNADPNGANSFYDAPLRLPDGAVITRLCVYLRNEEPTLSMQTAISINPARMDPGGEQSQVFPQFVVNPSFNTGYAEFCSDAGPYVFHDEADVDSDGSVDRVTHRFFFQQPSGATIGFGGVRVFWHREVSSAPTLASFGDVPTAHPFFAYVEALAASAITGGCGGGNFCPNAPLTRGQMAVFLAKALGLHWVN